MLYDEILKPFFSEDVAGDEEDGDKEPDAPPEDEKTPEDDSDEVEEI